MVVGGGVSGGGQRARHHFRPRVDVVLRVAGYDGLAGRAAGALNAHNVLFRRGEQSIGERVAQIRLFHKRQVLKIVDGADIRGLYALLVHALAIERHVFIFPLHHGAQPLALKRPKPFPIHTFDVRIPDFSPHIVLPFR